MSGNNILRSTTLTLIVERTRSGFWSTQSFENVAKALRVSFARCDVDRRVAVSVHRRDDSIAFEQQVYDVRLPSQNREV